VLHGISNSKQFLIFWSLFNKTFENVQKRFTSKGILNQGPSQLLVSSGLCANIRNITVGLEASSAKW